MLQRRASDVKTSLDFMKVVITTFPLLDKALTSDLSKNPEVVRALLREAFTSQNFKRVFAKIEKKRYFPKKELIVDCDQIPHMPDDMSLDGQGAEHQKMGRMKLVMRDGKLYANGCEVELYLSQHQQDIGTVIRGDKLRGEIRRLKNKRALNACLMQALTMHQEFIPDAWKTVGHIYFWNTVFCGAFGRLYVGYLFFFDGKWRWSYELTTHNWSERGPAACITDSPLAA